MQVKHRRTIKMSSWSFKIDLAWLDVMVFCHRVRRTMDLLHSEQGMWEHISLAALNLLFLIDSTRKDAALPRRQKWRTVFIPCWLHKGGSVLKAHFIFPKCQMAVFFHSWTQLRECFSEKVLVQFTTIYISWPVASRLKGPIIPEKKYSCF